MDSILCISPGQIHNGMPLFLTSVLTMGSTRTFSSGSAQHQQQAMTEKQVEDQRRPHRRKRRHRGHKILISSEYRNIAIQEIPAFDAKAIAALGSAAITHNNVTKPCHMENFEVDPSIAGRHFVMCRSRSFS